MDGMMLSTTITLDKAEIMVFGYISLQQQNALHNNAFEDLRPLALEF
jgi:hypothetical protein